MRPALAQLIGSASLQKTCHNVWMLARILARAIA
jgi:hypothetical protein